MKKQLSILLAAALLMVAAPSCQVIIKSLFPDDEPENINKKGNGDNNGNNGNNGGQNGSDSGQSGDNGNGGNGNEGNTTPDPYAEPDTTRINRDLKAVDMGTSVLWANYNIGAEAPEEKGDFFAWGETEPWALGYSGLSKYKFYDRANSPTSYAMFKKYATDSKYAVTPDNKAVLDPEDDAATVNWGSEWRMPTDEEKTAFLANTYHQRVVYRGVDGYLFTSKTTGNAIFMPCTGDKMSYNSEEGRKTFCGFWTSSLKPSDNQLAFVAQNFTGSGLMPEAGFEMDPTAESWHLSNYRWNGLPVRAVCAK